MPCWGHKFYIIHIIISIIICSKEIIYFSGFASGAEFESKNNGLTENDK